MKKTMKVFSLMVLFLGVTFASVADNGTDKNVKETTATTTCTITGKILDNVTGEALTGVKVEIPGTNLFTYSDFDGNFSFEQLEPGNYDIATIFISYKTTTFKDVDLKSGKDQTVKITLKPLTE